MTTKIRQCGVIESLNGTHARIQIMRSSACQTCEASNGCKVHSSKTMYVDVGDKRLAKYNKGDRVHVEMTAKSGRNAVIIGFGLPLLLFVASLLAIHYAGAKDETAAFCAIGVLVVYYLIRHERASTGTSKYALPIANKEQLAETLTNVNIQLTDKQEPPTNNF